MTGEKEANLARCGAHLRHALKLLNCKNSDETSRKEVAPESVQSS